MEVRFRWKDLLSLHIRVDRIVLLYVVGGGGLLAGLVARTLGV
jgi:hypothetical protein